MLLANTAPGASRSGTDELTTVEQLDALLAPFSFTGRIDHDEAELQGVRQTRDLVREVWNMDRDDAVTAVNRMLREAKALPSLVRHGTLDWHLHATSPDAPLAERLVAEAAMAFVDVIRMDEMDRLRECAAPDCTGLLVDLSRNGSKRFCSVRCSNRVNMVAHRARTSAERG